MANFSHMIAVIDTHAAGEPTRIVLSGLPPIRGATMAAKKQFMRDHLDHFRTLLMHEPRGHRDMLGAVLTPPTTPRGQYGLLFMDNAGYLDRCGHGTMSVTTVLIETGMIPPTAPETVVVFDTPAGVVEGHARVEGQHVCEVSVANVPSFLYAHDVPIELPDVGTVPVDVAFGGNFFALVQARALGVAVHPDQQAQLIAWGMRVKHAINAKLHIQHPTVPHITTVQLTEIYDQPVPSCPLVRNVVIYGHGHLDRSPCGTGTSAAMAARYARGALPLGVAYTSESIIGTRFTGIQQFVVDPRDPVKYGFRVGNSTQL